MPTVYIVMSKRCAIGYSACETCADKKKAAGEIGIMPDHDLTMEAVKRMKGMAKWPPKCAFCGGPTPYRITLESDATPEQIAQAVQEGLL